MQCPTPGINPSSLTLPGGRPTSSLTSPSFPSSRFPSFIRKRQIRWGGGLIFHSSETALQMKEKIPDGIGRLL